MDAEKALAEAHKACPGFPQHCSRAKQCKWIGHFFIDRLVLPVFEAGNAHPRDIAMERPASPLPKWLTETSR